MCYVAAANVQLCYLLPRRHGSREKNSEKPDDDAAPTAAFNFGGVQHYHLVAFLANPDLTIYIPRHCAAMACIKTAQTQKNGTS